MVDALLDRYLNSVQSAPAVATAFAQLRATQYAHSDSFTDEGDADAKSKECILPIQFDLVSIDPCGQALVDSVFLH